MTTPGEPIVIGFGGNVGEPSAIVERFRRAREALAVLGTVTSAPLYRGPPIGPPQPWFLNSAVAVRSADIQPDELIANVLEIERLLGRDRACEVRWGPRPIDLDVLVWGRRTLRTRGLEIPHPRLADRRFALEPVTALLGSDVVVAGLGTLGTLLARVADQAFEQIAETW
ncbi:MAG: 2-amino-4-hydroxy-6-hydroxymethyldihydropteridine diphosphokinase [Kofleriaceae bacterium]